MKTTYSSSNDVEKEFYFYLGLLSTKFAEMEGNLNSILGGIITDEVFWINPLIEKNSLSQNIEFLKKVNIHRRFEEEAVQELISRMDAIRKDRNLFIHALWGKPFEEAGEVLVDCHEQRISKLGRGWASMKEHSFTLSEIISRIDELDQIIHLQNNLLDNI